ncbi:MAG: nucleoside deaminase [Bacteroidetes bacterium]|nr:nucleoside deaminase [Bacteroidota bacterium]
MNEFMEAAIAEARASLHEGGIPIGAVLVRNNTIIGRGHNQRVQRNDPLAHAEIECIRNAGRIKTYTGTILYTTLMPCYLCAGAIVQFGIEHIVVGESRTYRGAEDFMKNFWVSIEDWDLDECISLMKDFIQKNPHLWNEDIGRL